VSRPERIIDPTAQFPALVPPGLAVATLGFSRSPFTLVDNAVAVVHALSMGLWLGGVVLLTRVVLAGPGDEDLVHAVRGFSRLSTPVMWVTVGTGAIMLFRLDRGAFGTSHGVTVIFKTLLVALMIMVLDDGQAVHLRPPQRVDVMTTPLASRCDVRSASRPSSASSCSASPGCC
jgi:copper transport protein